MVIDGWGSPFDQCTDLDGTIVLHDDLPQLQALWCEKDSFYHFDGRDVIPLIMDFSALRNDLSPHVRMPATEHLIGGFYAAISFYVFGNLDDAGKLMGVQTVDRGWNPAFARLIEAFHARTGIPALLNTSFNKRGMPIVETPGDAVALFAETALDALVLQDVLVIKRPR